MGHVADSFYKDVFAGLGITVTEQLLLFARAWQRAEGGTAAHNPWNATLAVQGSTRFNSIGVQNYPTHAAGVKATVSMLKQANMATILHSLQRLDDPYFTAVEVARSPWGTDGWLLVQVLHDEGVGRTP